MRADQIPTRELLEEFHQRFNNRPDFLGTCFPKQSEFIQDPSKRKFGFCTRRAGKTEGCVRWLLDKMWSSPHRQSLYVALTRSSAKYIAWPIFKRLDREMNLGLHFDNQELVATLPNGAWIRLLGADANQDEKAKLLGQANELVIVDECASFKPHIKELIKEVIEPTLWDYRGTLAMIGTPGDVAAGYFFDVTTGKEPGWSGHQWSALDNPFMKEQVEQEIADMIERYGEDVVNLPWYRRMWLGQWVTDQSNLVYHFNRKALFDMGALMQEKEHLVWGMGIDLGWTDETAFTLIAWDHRFTDKLYVVKTFKQSKMTFQDVEDRINQMCAGVGIKEPHHLVIDNASKQGVEDMRVRFKRNFKPAEKTGKADYIGLMNTDMSLNRILLPASGACDDLVEEWMNLVWHKEKKEMGVLKEDPRCKNHLSDATLYIWRYARHFLYDPPVEKPKRGTPEYLEAEVARMLEQDEVQHFRRASMDPWSLSARGELED